MSAPDLVTLSVHRVAARRVPAAFVRMATDRRRLARTPGAVFSKLLGTGDGRTFDLRDADLRTWALLVAWTTQEAWRRFDQRSPVAQGWREISDERWVAELRPVSAKGEWAGRQPFGTGRRQDPGEPVAAITRARLRPSRMRTFWRAVPPVTLDLARRDGLLMALGIGEAPIGLQGTFSVWTSGQALTDFAYRGEAHRRAIRQTAQLDWYSEELFARFAVLRTHGTLDGRDPLAPA